MREIKFRAWNKKNNKMYYFPEMGICSEYNLLSFIWDGDTGTNYGAIDWEIENYEVMQFTGLKDKNGEGQEMYQDDICKANYYCEIVFDNEPHNLVGTIEWDDTFGMWMYDYGHGSTPLTDENLRDIEIIGNIHQNPELLI